jgi:hypothetical protein
MYEIPTWQSLVPALILGRCAKVWSLLGLWDKMNCTILVIESTSIASIVGGVSSRVCKLVVISASTSFKIIIIIKLLWYICLLF